MEQSMYNEENQPYILVVDDEADIRDMLKRHFTFLGFNVHVANDGQDALEKLNQRRYEVVISDIDMPRMSGLELLDHIQKNFPMTHCIIITGYVTMDNALSAMRLGADTIVFKPLEDLEELNIAINNAVDHLKHWQKKLKTLIKMKP